ncbi:MAG: prephenate dehydratase [Phycisphaerae bacterium]
MPKKSDDLSKLRHEIDQLDEQLVHLLNRRAEVVVQIGKLKNRSNEAIYVPDREKKVLDHVRTVNKGPLPDKVISAIYRELMSGCIALEKPLKVGYLGPEGSFSNIAAVLKFGAAVEYVPLPDIRSVFMDVARGHCNLGMVPVENSLGGSVIDTLDAFLELDVKICAEMIFRIHHNLLANCPLEQIRVIYSKPEVFAQCRNWLSMQMKGIQTVPVASTSRAAELAAQEPNAAAIGSTLASELYKLAVVDENIEDNPNNFTRFFVISRYTAKPTGQDKTAILFATAHRAGTLADVLDIFRKYKVNLTNIDTRPSGNQTWEYYFFVDTEGHYEDPQVQAAIAEAREHCLLLSVLGSFAKATEPIEK